MSWISRHKLPVILTAVVLVLAGVAIALVTLVVQPRHADQAAYQAAKSSLAAANTANTAAHKKYDATLKAVTELQLAMSTLPSAPKSLFPADTLSTLSDDVKTLDQAAGGNAPTAVTFLPKGDVTYKEGAAALARASSGVRENTTLTKDMRSALQNTLTAVTDDLRDAAETAGTQSQAVLVANQGATDATQTAFAAASDINTDGTAAAIVDGLNQYVAVGKQVIAENKEHPVVEEPVEEPTPDVDDSPSAAPTVSASPSPKPSTAPSAAPSSEPSPPVATPVPVDHTPRVDAKGAYEKTCSAPTALFTQTTTAGNTITLDESYPYTYTTYPTDTGFGVKVSSCTTS